MALLRALTVSLEVNSGADICDYADHQVDEHTHYYHMVICAESTVKQEENILRAAAKDILDESALEDPQKEAKLDDINDVNRLIKKKAKNFKTHFIKYNNNKDKQLTEEITSLILVLNQHGFKYVAKDHSEISLKIKTALESFNGIRSTTITPNIQSIQSESVDDLASLQSSQRSER